jgi:hypothetical protein
VEDWPAQWTGAGFDRLVNRNSNTRSEPRLHQPSQETLTAVIRYAGGGAGAPIGGLPAAQSSAPLGNMDF